MGGGKGISDKVISALLCHSATVKMKSSYFGIKMTRGAGLDEPAELAVGLFLSFFWARWLAGATRKKTTSFLLSLKLAMRGGVSRRPGEG